MKPIYWIIGAAVLFYLYSKSQASAQLTSSNALNSSYASDATSIATGILEDV